MPRKYTNLKNLTPEEFREYKSSQARERRRKRRLDPEYKAKQNAAAAKSRKKLKEKIKERRLDRFYNDPEYRAKIDASAKAWVEKNKDRIKENVQKWNLVNKTTVTNFAARSMAGQRDRSKKRGHQPPAYTKEELTAWLLDQPNWIQLCSDWKKSNFESDLAPSIDRLDNSKGYSFDNIQLITWKENRLKK